MNLPQTKPTDRWATPVDRSRRCRAGGDVNLGGAVDARSCVPRKKARCKRHSPIQTPAEQGACSELRSFRSGIHAGISG